MTDEQWKILQQFDAHKKETKEYITGFEAFWIAFFVTSYLICLTVALLGD